MTEGQSDGRRRQCGRVIDAIANEQGGGATDFLAGDGDLLLGRLSRVDLVDADVFREVPDFTLPIA
jgi:hypothetical protein